MLLVLSLACDTFPQLALVRSATRPTDRMRNQSGGETELSFSRVRLGCRKNSTLVFCVLPGQALKVNVEWNVCLIRWIYFSCHLSTGGFLLAPPLLSPVVTAQLSELRNLFCSADYLFRRCAALTLFWIQFLRYSVSLMSVTSSPETKLTSTQNIMKGIWGDDGLSQQTGQAMWKVVSVKRESQVAARDGQNPPSSGVFWELTGCVHCLSPVRNVIVWYSVLFYWLFIIILLVFSLCLKKTHIVSTKYLRTEEKKWFCL